MLRSFLILALSLSYYRQGCLGLQVVLVFVLGWDFEVVVLVLGSEALFLCLLRFLVLRLLGLLQSSLQSLLLRQSPRVLDLLKAVLGSLVETVQGSLVLGFLVLAVCVRWSLGMPGQALE